MAGTDPAVEVLQRLVSAVNGHRLDDLVACFAADYRNETPVHPRRSFQGRGQVQGNWSEIFSRVPDIQARVDSTAGRGGSLWTEWELAGTRTDGAAFLMRGVVIFRIADGEISSARFYLEPVEAAGGDVNAAVRRVLGRPLEDGNPKAGTPASRL
ncbi:nuclear transport factor 2 family protein [Arthrobacter sp. AFG7.2]|uniref:nuclear transport factor 2 family protein n=1 Tax=Arthrobacter sp. AFG7.2 TaxID=1688693 RepID=UPI000C9E61FE|nr:nuclear transport factor 2 family protein [Arthrobacter sp. AFG7.2]PNI09477.1 nuclear transport factor 2 family protein [Arthrobacter sp. AFG7.2]